MLLIVVWKKVPKRNITYHILVLKYMTVGGKIGNLTWILTSILKNV